MQFPQLNINGTDGETLREEYLRAWRHLETAIAALLDVTVHGRDYPSAALRSAQGEPPRMAITIAADEHRARIEKLQQVERELERLVEHIDRQLNDSQGWRSRL
jgi:hypothetical protein